MPDLHKSGSRIAGQKSKDAMQSARELQSREQLDRGGLTLDTEQRLNTLRANKRLFTSNLSVNEFVLGESGGFSPIGQVMGSTIYHTVNQGLPPYRSGELKFLSRAQHQSRHRALGRLQQEAKLLGAHGVIGVRLERKRHEWGQNLLEWTARGTAVASSGSEPFDLPFVCALSGQEFWALQQAGYQPVGFAFGTCVFYHIASVNTQYVTQAGKYGGYSQNIELADYTKAVYQTRRIAMQRLTEDAAQVQADGIVGVLIESDIRTHEAEGRTGSRKDLFVTFTALGTAITTSPCCLPTIDYSMPLSD